VNLAAMRKNKETVFVSGTVKLKEALLLTEVVEVNVAI